MNFLKVLFRYVSEGLWAVPLVLFISWRRYEGGANGAPYMLTAGLYVAIYVVLRAVYKWRSSRGD
jgi:hypothetical protein